MRLKLFLSLTTLAFAMTAQAADRVNCGVLIMDPQGAVIPGATVTVLSWNKDSQKLDPVQEKKTNDAGQIRFVLLPDKYEISVAAPGFQTGRMYLDVVPGRECSIQHGMKVASKDIPLEMPNDFPPLTDDPINAGRVVAPDLSGSFIPEVPVKPFVLPKKLKARR